ncbi:hypothetical protein R6Z07F_012224 [Ovis aries]
MFKKFDEKENVSNCIQLKTSVIKGIKNQLLEQFPGIEPWLNQIMPKKDPVKIVRCHEHIEILTVNGELLFFRQREGPFYPTLRLLHKYPFILPRQQVDKGAIKFVLSGANIMCPGLTSPGARLFPAAVDTVVAIMAEGKQHALCVGVMKMSADEIEKVNKGIGIENIHYLNDGLWHMKTYNGDVGTRKRRQKDFCLPPLPSDDYREGWRSAFQQKEAPCPVDTSQESA